MTKAEAVAKYLKENTQYMRDIPEPYIIMVVAELENTDDKAWFTKLKQHWVGCPGMSPNDAAEMGSALKEAVKGLEK